MFAFQYLLICFYNILVVAVSPQPKAEEHKLPTQLLTNKGRYFVCILYIMICVCMYEGY